MNDTAINLEHLSKYYKLYDSPSDRFKEALDPLRRKRYREFYALNNINLQIKKGEILGVIGRNGSGKSTLLKLIAGVIQPSSGNLTVKGNVSAMLELGSGLNPDLSGIDNIYFGGIMMGFSREEMTSRMDEIINFADIGTFINQPLKTYSSGMKARLGFALAVNINPDILVIDEVLSVGDDLFRRKCYAKMEEFFKGGKTIIYVSHSVPSINELCTKVVMLDRGEIIMEGPAKFVTSNYQKLLFAKKEAIEKTRTELIGLNRNKQLKQAVYDAILKDKKNNILEMGASAITDEIIDAKMLTEKPDAQIIQKAQEIVKERPILLPDFITLTTNKIINSNIEIDDFSINTLNGQKVNSLIRNEYYFFSYRITFNEQVDKINYGFGIRSDRGLPLSWRVHPGGRLFESRHVMPGDTYMMKWKFKCTFYYGNYYISITLRTIHKNQDIKINKIDDAFVFNVAQKAKDRGGFFDSDIECEMIKMA